EARREGGRGWTDSFVRSRFAGRAPLSRLEDEGQGREGAERTEEPSGPDVSRAAEQGSHADSSCGIVQDLLRRVSAPVGRGLRLDRGNPAFSAIIRVRFPGSEEGGVRLVCWSSPRRRGAH